MIRFAIIIVVFVSLLGALVFQIATFWNLDQVSQKLAAIAIDPNVFVYDEDGKLWGVVTDRKNDRVFIRGATQAEERYAERAKGEQKLAKLSADGICIDTKACPFAVNLYDETASTLEQNIDPNAQVEFFWDQPIVGEHCHAVITIGNRQHGQRLDLEFTCDDPNEGYDITDASIRLLASSGRLCRVLGHKLPAIWEAGDNPFFACGLCGERFVDRCRMQEWQEARP
jgi:hypothetical protein